ncbi:hypothetical protein RHMOL_Rhmol07G0289900 [Rhododendron molle]|uniref:Uncharacterized protein n=1 Tax=Rhododendron molle TaxID=49168 RepID=A0ACC0N7D3_RHOML|nr:hypothetical protein RHMOL_Rhmol07G0289900 [Rhododendron molle]
MFTFLSLILLAHAISPASSQEKNIFLLAGQSNMSGRGGVTNGTWDGFVPPECGPNPSVLRLAANLTWVPAAEPLHKDIDVNVTAGVGPGMSFANALLAHDPGLGVVGLVPCAIGGTKISQWVRGSFLYDQLVRRADAAARGGGKIQAMLWYQGESDTVDEEDAESYKGRLEKFFEDLRSDLQFPSLPIIQVAIASAQGPFIEKVREAQLRLDLANVKCVDAKGLELGPDHLHLTTSAEVQLGKMLADSFLQTRPRPLKNNAPSSYSLRGGKSKERTKAMFTFLSLILLAQAISPGSSHGKNIFLLAGQSNMSGRGGLTNSTWDGVVPPECGPNPSVLRLAANLTWVPAAEPLHKDIDVNVTVGVGPGMSFANSVLANDSSLRVVGLVPCAVGGTRGTKISQWVRGSMLYEQLVRRAGAAVRGGGKIQAMLWYQGESDTVDKEDAELYKGRLEKFFVDLRSDLQSPSLPIIQVAIASAQGSFIKKVREAQLRLDLANVKCVDAKGLELGPDHLHLTTSAEVQLGEMLAGSFLRTRPRPPQE